MNDENMVVDKDEDDTVMGEPIVAAEADTHLAI